MQALASLPSGQVPVIVSLAAEIFVPFAVAPESQEHAAMCISQLAAACFQHLQVTGHQADTLAATADELISQVLQQPLACEVS